MFGLVAPETLLMASLFVTGLLLFISVYFMITLSDLESDYLNSRQCSDKLNLFTWPRLALLAFHSILVIITLGIGTRLSFSSESFVPVALATFSSLHIMACLSLPENSFRCSRKGEQRKVHNPLFPGNSGLYDPTEVHVRSNLRASIKESLGQYKSLVITLPLCTIYNN